MEKVESSQDAIHLSVEKVIDIVRDLRNTLIKVLLQDENVKIYFTEKYNKELSAVKTEFLKRDLKELLISPVDLSHYSSLIKQIREHNSASLAEGNQDLFYKELDEIFRKYNF